MTVRFYTMKPGEWAYRRGPWLGGHWLHLGRLSIYWRTKRNDWRLAALVSQETGVGAGLGENE